MGERPTLTILDGRGAAAPPRIMYYSHDTFGLGHLRRTLTIARYVERNLESVTQLIITGSPVAGDLVLPGDTDYVKLPSVVKVGPEAYAARSVATTFDELRDMRAALILGAARHFRPDILIADHAPAGLKGELLPTLRYLKQRLPACRLVAGLRDVVDADEQVRRAWAAEGIYPLFDQVYDRIVVYGQRDVYDLVGRYGLSPAAAAKTRYLGYLKREAEAPAPSGANGDSLADRPLVVFTVGGGGDGELLLRTALEAARRQRADPPWRALLATGPLMAPAERAELLAQARDLPAVRVVEGVAGLAGEIARADAVVAMGGYNTVCELLSFERPALIVPRVAPRREQLIRAEALARRGLVRVLHPDRLDADTLDEAILALLRAPARPRAPVSLEGLPALVDLLGELLPGAAGRTPLSAPEAESGVRGALRRVPC